MDKNRVKQLKGTKVKLSEYVFSYSKKLKNLEYDCLDVRFKTKLTIDVNTLDEGTVDVFELLLKRKGMKKAQWTKPIR